VSAWEQFAIAFCETAKTQRRRHLAYTSIRQNPSQPYPLEPREVVRQFFLFVRAGAVWHQGNGSVDQRDAIAFRNGNGRYVVVIARKNANFTVRGLPAGDMVSSTPPRRPWDVNLPDVTIRGGGGAVAMPAAGYLTIYQR
jgi:hypothetical protein